MSIEVKKIQTFHYRYTQLIIDVSSQAIELIDSKNLRWPLIFCFFCFFAFWTELTNYHYYKYFTKWLPVLAIAVHMMVHLECLDKAFYDKFSYADYTAIGFIISIPGDILFMIEDNNMGLMPGICMFLIMNIWYGLSFFPLLYYHRKQKLTKCTYDWQSAVTVATVATVGVCYLNAQLILSISEYDPIYLTYSYAGTQAIMVFLQIIRKPYTLPRSYAYTCTGTILDLFGTSLFFLVRTGNLQHWFFRLLWISLHYFGQFLLSRGMLLHSWWWEAQLLMKKRRDDALKRVEYQKKKFAEEERKKKEIDSINRQESETPGDEKETLIKKEERTNHGLVLDSKELSGRGATDSPIRMVEILADDIDQQSSPSKVQEPAKTVISQVAETVKDSPQAVQ